MKISQGEKIEEGAENNKKEDWVENKKKDRWEGRTKKKAYEERKKDSNDETAFLTRTCEREKECPEWAQTK